MFMRDLVDHPLSAVTDRYDRLGLSRRRGNEIRKDLIDSCLFKQVGLPTASGVTALLQLTPRGVEELRGLDPGRAARAKALVSLSLEHEYWRTRVAEHLGANGFEVDAEAFEPAGGHALTLMDQAKQDVLGADVVVVEQPGFFLS